MQTPIGERKSTLALQSAGGALTGKLTGEEGNATDIYEGKLSGNSASWKADIKNPMPLTLAFTGNGGRRQDFRHRQRRRHRQLAVQRHQVGLARLARAGAADVAELPCHGRKSARLGRRDRRQPARILQGVSRRGSRGIIVDALESDHRPAMTLLAVRHTTTYRYRRPVSFGEHRMMFRPRDSYDQKLLEAWLTHHAASPPTCAGCTTCSATASPSPISATSRAHELRFESNIWLDHSPSNAPDFEIEDYARNYPFSYAPEEMADLLPAMTPQYPDPDRRSTRWVRRFLRKGQPTDTGMLLMTLTYAFKESFTYERRSEPGTRQPAVTLELGRGSCRDLALLMIEAVRSLGLRGALRVGLPLRAEPRRPAAPGRRLDARVVPGVPARARAGWSSTPPTPSSATATSSASRWRAIRARPCRFRAPTSALPTTSST